MAENNFFGTAMKLGGLAINMLNDYSNKQPSSQPSSQPSGNKSGKIRSMIKFCSYPERSVELISMAAENALKQYPDLDCDILSFYEGNIKKSFIQLKGKVPVDFRGSTYGVNMSLMIPQTFPNKPPFIRIINQNPEKYAVDPFYANCKSQSDPNSYLLNNLSSIMNWGYQSSVVGVIREALQTMSGRFPFRKRKAQDEVNTQEAYTNNYYPGSGYAGQQNQPGFGFNTQLPDYSSNPTNPTYPVGSFNPTFQPQPMPAYNYGNPTMPSANVGFYNPAQQKARKQLQDYLTKSRTFSNQLRQTADILQRGHQKIQVMTQNMDCINRSLIQQNFAVKLRTEQLANLIKASEASADTIDVKTLVVPSDDFSSQLMDYVAENKAWAECADFVEAQFSGDKITLEVFLKTMRKVEEEKFLSGYMVKKCIRNRMG